MKTNHLILLVSVALAAVSVAADVRSPGLSPKQRATLASTLANMPVGKDAAAEKVLELEDIIIVEKKPIVEESPGSSGNRGDADHADNLGAQDIAHRHESQQRGQGQRSFMLDKEPVVEITPLTPEEEDRAIQNAFARQTHLGIADDDDDDDNGGVMPTYVFDPSKKSFVGYDEDGRQQVVNVGPGLVRTADGKTRSRGGGPLGQQRGSIVPNEYIIFLKPGADCEAFDIRGMVEEQNRLIRLPPKDPNRAEDDSESEPIFENQVVHEYDFGTWKGYSGRFTPEFVKELEEHDDVDYVEEDRVMWAWGIPRNPNRKRGDHDGDHVNNNNGGDDSDDIYNIGAAEAAKQTLQRVQDFIDERAKRQQQWQRAARGQEIADEKEADRLLQRQRGPGLQTQGGKPYSQGTSKDTNEAYPGLSEVADWQLQPVQAEMDMDAAIDSKGSRERKPAPTHNMESQTEIIETRWKNTPSWGLVRISERRPDYTKEYSFAQSAGADVDVYVIDSGVYASHQDFDGRARMVANYVTGEPDTDLAGHGTHVSGTIAGRDFGVAKEANILAVKVLDRNGQGKTSQVLAGINFVIAHASQNPGRRRVINMSLGGDRSKVVDDAVREAVNRFRIPVFVAAGNTANDACQYSPGGIPESFAVGGTDRNDKKGWYSCTGRCVQLFAPGSAIQSDWNQGRQATHILDGTSMATPHVTGVAALFLGTGMTFTTVPEFYNKIVQFATKDAVRNLDPRDFSTPRTLLYNKQLEYPFSVDESTDDVLAGAVRGTNAADETNERR
ncbi:hypothetical protein BGZ73_001879 [Actinomortierella ambigua]|nr:hypothetical protein BGZ73_001879 [Actinomortierella ambigua]